jgi:magnesium chelatase subunit I
VRVELRANVLRRIAASTPIIEGVSGYEATVLPELERALVAGHDVVFLGERGQAKSRIIRGIAQLLDPAIPIVAGSLVNDDPVAPISAFAREIVAAMGDETPIDWIGPEQRYGEKLATPDTSMADLIGEVDPIKVAEGRYLSDESTLHFGLVPRSNRGIFAMNELPDLAERIQVGLLDVLEERDIQIRGHKLRLPLDVLFLASANPEDYTSRGRMITPLKDRFGSEIRTHYPLDADAEAEIVLAEAVLPVVPGISIDVPRFMTEIVAQMSQLARRSSRIDQRSGVSVRLGIANEEILVAAALCRAARRGARTAAPRVSDLGALLPTSLGKLELEGFDDSEDDVVGPLLRAAVLATFRARCPSDHLGTIVGAFDDGVEVTVGADLDAVAYLEHLGRLPGLRESVAALTSSEDPEVIASAIELVLEGLHLAKRCNKEPSGAGARYRAR